jgi:hypothetical protein
VKFATIGRYASSERPWRRLLEIATDHFADMVEDLAFLRAEKTRIELHVDETDAAYFVKLVGPDVERVEARRTAQSRVGFGAALVVLAADIIGQELADARRLARQAATGELSPKYARSLCEGFGYPTFDAELTRYQAEIAVSKAARRKQAKRWPLGRRAG